LIAVRGEYYVRQNIYQKAESQKAEFKRQKIKWQKNQKAGKTKGRKSKGRNDRLYTVFQNKFTLLLFAITKSDVDLFQ